MSTTYPPCLASHSVFHVAFILSEFQITARKLYHHYLHAANSHHIPERKLIPHTGMCLQTAYAHHTQFGRETSFHEYCIADRYVCWRSFQRDYYASYGEVIATEINCGAPFVMGPYSSLRNVWWMTLVNKSKQTLW